MDQTVREKRKGERMGARQKQALRPLSEAERHELQRVVKASSERVDTVKRAKALLALAEGKTFTQAGSLSGLSREGVSQLADLLSFLQHKHDVSPTSKRMKMEYDRSVVATTRSETGWSMMPETQADLRGVQDP